MKKAIFTTAHKRYLIHPGTNTKSKVQIIPILFLLTISRSLEYLIHPVNRPQINFGKIITADFEQQ